MCADGKTAQVRFQLLTEQPAYIDAIDGKIEATGAQIADLLKVSGILN
jgi:hypothetical protein